MDKIFAVKLPFVVNNFVAFLVFGKTIATALIQ
jgi:hypothetical protein